MRILSLFSLLLLCSVYALELPRIGLVLDKGGRDDKSFNSAAFRGAGLAEKELKIKVKTVESSDDTALEANLRTFSQRGYTLVIGIGFVQQTPVERVAAQFPKIHYLLVDSVVDKPNVASVVFKEHEGSFLVGAIAALTTKTNTIGFVGGMDIPLIRRFEMGYIAGAKHINPNIHILSNFVGSSSDAWRNPTKAKELALNQYNKKVDIIFAPAGASGLGVFDAAEERGKFAIGCDSNQNGVKPGKILTSMLKKVDVAVFDSIKAEVQGKFVGGKMEIGLKEGGIDYSLDEHNRSILTPAVEEKANAIKKKIIAGEITVPDYYVKKK